MEPQANREPALHLPQPMPEHTMWRQPAQLQPERPAMPEMSGGAASMPAPAQPQMAAPASQPAQQMMQPVAAPASATSTTSAKADDANADEIWITKAKRIVEQTHTNPFLESQEIGKVKVEYLKERHGKIVKAVEDKS